MKSYEWFKSFDTGNTVIDAQHRELLERINQLATLVGEGKGKDASDKCQEIQQLLNDHFAEEEDILRAAEFSHLDDHLESHMNTTGRFSHVCSSCDKACLDNRAGPCIQDMTTIIIHHILGDDMKFKSFLQIKGLANQTY